MSSSAVVAGVARDEALRVLTAPGIVSLDAGLFKDIRLTERWKAQLRAEAFNVANTPHFNAPDGNAWRWTVEFSNRRG